MPTVPIPENMSSDASPQALATVLDGVNQLQQLAALMIHPTVGYTSLPASASVPGVDGMSLSDYYLSAFDRHWNDISAGMGQASRKLFDGPAAAMRDDLAKRLQQHEAGQRDALQAQARQEAVAKTADVAATEAADTVDATYEPFSPEAFRRKVVEPVINHQLSENRISDARRFLDRYRHDINPDSADVLNAKVAAAESYEQGASDDATIDTDQQYEVAGLDGIGLKSPEGLREQKVLKTLAAKANDPFVQFDEKLGRLVHSYRNPDGSISKTLLDADEVQAFKRRVLDTKSYPPGEKSKEEWALEDLISPDEDYDLSVSRFPEPLRPTVRVSNARALLRDPRVRAYLDTIAYAEGYGYGKPVAYNAQFGDDPNAGIRHLFDSYDAFPSSSGVKFGKKQPTANGRYQITRKTYDEFSKKLGLTDFSPDTQDMMAVQMLIESGTIKALWHGDFSDAVNRSGRWASIPTLNGGVWQRRKSDQLTVPFEKLQQYYEERLSEHSRQQWLEDQLPGIVKVPDARPPLWQSQLSRKK